MSRQPQNAPDLTRMTKKERQAYQREVNRIEREERARRSKIRRRIVWSSLSIVLVAALAVTGIWGYGVIAAGYTGPEDMLSDGIQFISSGTTSTASSNSITETATSGIGAWGTPVATTNDFASTGQLTAQVYLDYSSTDSATFWSTNSSNLGTWIVSAYLKLELHPVALDTSNEYAVRAVAAMGCVADGDPENAWAVNSALLTATTTAKTDGTALSVDNLESIVSNAGVTDSATLSCVSSGKFRYWAEQASKRAAAGTLYDTKAAITKTPVLASAGLIYDGPIDNADKVTTFLSSDAVKAAIASASASASASADASNSASGSASASASASPSASK